MYNELKDIFQYLVSVRKLKNYLSVDIEFPTNWKIPKRFVEEDKIMENERVNDNKRFFSFVSEFDELTVDRTINNIKKIVSYNKEIELKEKLLKQKIDELKKIFENKNLENLQNLKFELLEEKILTREEQALDWLKSEIEKDKMELENNKKKLVDSIKTFQKEEIVKPPKKLTLWQKIKKALL